MSFLNAWTVTDGRLQLTTTAPSPGSAANGRFYDAAGAVYVADSASVVSWANGMAFGTGGAMLIYDASLGLPAATVYHSGLPRYNDRLCVDVLNAADHVANGVPFTPSGAVAAGGVAGSFSLTTSFYAPLQTSLVPLTAAGSGVPTFTRATPAYVSDFEGVLRQAVSGEARFSGARRVRNWLATSDVENALWQAQGATKTTGQPDPDGGSHAVSIAVTANVGNNFNQALTIGTTGPASGTTQAFSAYVKGVSGQQIYMSFNSSSTVPQTLITFTGNWQRMLHTGIQSGANGVGQFVGFETYGRGSNSDLPVGITFSVYKPQLEDVTGSLNPAPSEYVSVGVLAAPWHGAGVDGVRYFSTANPNSVSGNVVTTVPGYSAGGVRTNICLQSQTFDNAAWTKSFSTVAANTTTAPDGTTTVDSLLETAVNNEHVVYQTFTATAAPYTFSVYVKSLGRQWIYLRLDDAATPSRSYFDIQNGTIGSVTGPAANPTITNLGNGWYRCTVTRTATAAPWYPVLGCADVDGGVQFLGDVTKGVYVWGAQVESGSTATAYIPTTAAQVSVATPATGGTAIPAATLLGYLAEGQRTNLALQSQTFENAAWTKRVAFTITADSTAAPDGTVTADMCDMGAGSDMYQQVSMADGVCEPSFYIKKITAAGSFKLSNPASAANGDWSIDLSLLSTAWERITKSHPAVTIIAAFVGAGGTGAGIQIRQGSAVLSFYLWGAQLEAAPFASSYIPTTTAAATRNGDVLTYPSAGNFAEAAGTVYAEYQFYAAIVGSPNIVGDGSAAAGTPLYWQSIYGANAYDLTNGVNGVGGQVANTLIKGSVAWGANLRAICNGGAIGTSPYDGAFGIASIGIGCQGTPWYGTIRNVRIYAAALTDAQLINITAP